MSFIMVVEDERDIRDVLVEVLTDEGFDILAAETADAALPLLHREKVRLIVTDINLPGAIDGIALARAARERQPSIPIVFISGRPGKLHDAGAVGDPSVFLQKPFSLRGLVSDVQRLVIAS
jgi:DNA-binding response OmpR family regulator